MNILYVSHKVITFILNEVVALKGLGHEVSILTPHNDRHVFNNIVKPFLVQNDLHGSIYFNHRLSGHQPRAKKLADFLQKICKDFISRPAVTLRYLALMPSHYKRIGAGIDDYLDLRLMLDRKYNVLYSSFSTPAMIDQIYFISQVLKVPFILAFRAHDMYEGENLAEIISRKDKIKQAAALVTISHSNEAYAKKHFLGEKEVHIIHSAVDLDFFSRKGLSTPQKNSIVAVGRFHEQKGLINLVYACHILAQRNVSYQCTLIGRGGEEEKYRETIARLKIPNVSIVNYLDRDGIRLELSKANIFALPCIVAKSGLRDILPNAVKEAMAMELPVVTSDVAGIEELVENGKSGILTPPNNPEALAEALEKLLADEEMQGRMGKEGRIKVENDFNITTEIIKLERVFLNSGNNFNTYSNLSN